jgi:hypothetical protein
MAGGNPYAAPAAAVAAGDDQEAARLAAARRLGWRALLVFIGGLAVGGGCAIPLGIEVDDATRVRHHAGYLALIVVALGGQLAMLGGMVVGIVAVARGALRRRRPAVAGGGAPP